MTSMTGYAYRELVQDGITLSVEIKSVNSRYLDLSVSAPPFLGQIEKRLKEAASARIARGKVDVYVRVKETSSNERVTPDIQAARSYYAAISQVAEALGKSADVPLELVLQQEGVLCAVKEYDIDKYSAMLDALFADALDAFVCDCAREGQNLYADLLGKVAQLEQCAAFFRQWQPKMEEMFRQIVTRKFNELLGESADQQRVMMETAALLVKYTINEEIVRLDSHLAALRKEMAENPAPGKKIDFLCQEINREINTIGSKNQFVEIGAMVITAKDALENIREQARNVA